MKTPRGSSPSSQTSISEGLSLDPKSEVRAFWIGEPGESSPILIPTSPDRIESITTAIAEGLGYVNKGGVCQGIDSVIPSADVGERSSRISGIPESPRESANANN